VQPVDDPSPKVARADLRTGPRTGSLRRVVTDVLFVARREKKLWLSPLILIVLLIAALLAIATLAGPVAPFIYPLL
jgi:hypothetical protein